MALSSYKSINLPHKNIYINIYSPHIIVCAIELSEFVLVSKLPWFILFHFISVWICFFIIVCAYFMIFLGCYVSI
jgi:hypothetical protein